MCTLVVCRSEVKVFARRTGLETHTQTRTLSCSFPTEGTEKDAAAEKFKKSMKSVHHLISQTEAVHSLLRTRGPGGFGINIR